jgi:hypothetical protein
MARDDVQAVAELVEKVVDGRIIGEEHGPDHQSHDE